MKEVICAKPGCGCKFVIRNIPGEKCPKCAAEQKRKERDKNWQDKE